MNGFYLECHFILRKCWFEVGQNEFKHPVLAKVCLVKKETTFGNGHFKTISGHHYQLH